MSALPAVAVSTNRTLYILMIVRAIGSLALYRDVVLQPPASTPAAFLSRR